MTVSTLIRSAVLDANGSTTVFPFSFRVLEEGHLTVQRRVTSTGLVAETYAIDTDYTLSGLGTDSGSVTFGTAPASGNEIVITRSVPLTQALDIVNQGGFYPDTIEEQFDLTVMMVQQVSEGLDRAAKVNIGTTADADIANGEVLGKVGGIFTGVDNSSVAAAQSALDAETSATAAASSATDASNVAADLALAKRYVVIYIHYGQSLSLRRANKVTTSIPTKLLMPNGGTQSADWPEWVNATQWVDPAGAFDSLEPFAYPDDAEDTSPGLAYQWFNDDPLCDYICAVNPGSGGLHWRELRVGTNHWANMSTAVRNIYDRFIAMGYSSLQIIPVFQFTQGEAEAAELAPGGGTNDPTPPTASDMQDIWTNLRTQLVDMLTEVWGRSMTSTPVILTPMNTNANDYAWGFEGVQAGFVAQVEVGGFVVLPPAYQFYANYATDGVHRTGQAQRYYGELTSSIIRRAAIYGADYPQPTITHAVVGDSVVLTGDFGSTGLEFDEISPSLGHADSESVKGFEYWDDSASAYVTPISVTVSGDTITVALPVTPATGDRLEYAQQPWPGGTQITDHIPRGDIITTRAAVTAEDGTALYDPILNQRWEIA